MTADDEIDALLRAIIVTLDGIGIPHMIVGSFASTFHGEPRTTRDLDLVIDPTAPQLDELLAALDPELYYVDPDVARDALKRRTMFNVIEIATAWKVDLVIRKARPFSIEELRRRQLVTMLGAKVATATAEDTIVAKLEWAKDGGSQRQLEDVAGILRVRAGTLDLAYIERWIDELELTEQWRLAQERAGRK
jgi:hypothetical protein